MYYYILQINWVVLKKNVILVYDYRWIRGNVLLHYIIISLNLHGQVSVFISTRNRVAQLSSPLPLEGLRCPPPHRHPFYSKPKLHYDQRSLGQSVLVSRTHVTYMNRFVLPR
jgi:hypothetical protein